MLTRVIIEREMQPRVLPRLPLTLASGARIVFFANARSALGAIICRNAPTAFGIARRFAVERIARSPCGPFGLVLRRDVRVVGLFGRYVTDLAKSCHFLSPSGATGWPGPARSSSPAG